MTQRRIAGGTWLRTISPKSRSSAPSPRGTTRPPKASAPTSTLSPPWSPHGKCQQTLALQLHIADVRLSRTTFCGYLRHFPLNVPSYTNPRKESLIDVGFRPRMKGASWPRMGDSLCGLVLIHYATVVLGKVILPHAVKLLQIQVGELGVVAHDQSGAMA